MRNKTTSIKRPEPPPASREGESRVADISRPIPEAQRISRRPQVALAIGIGVLVVVVVLLAAVFILPIGTWREQDDQLNRLRDEEVRLSEVIRELEAEVGRLDTDAGIAEAAREELGVIEDGQQQVLVLPPPPLPRDLPNGWPYMISEQILKVRRAEAREATGD